jgi:hypothetical protein
VPNLFGRIAGWLLGDKGYLGKEWRAEAAAHRLQLVTPLRFEGFGKGATLTHEGDIWTVHYADGAETFKLVGVNELASGDAVFA